MKTFKEYLLMEEVGPLVKGDLVSVDADAAHKYTKQFQNIVGRVVGVRNLTGMTTVRVTIKDANGYRYTFDKTALKKIKDDK